MLQNIRERVQGWIAWVILLLIAIAFTFWGVDRIGSNSGRDANKVIVKVNKEEITNNQFNNAYQHSLKQLQAEANIALTPQTETQLKKEVLDQLISNTILQQAAYKQGMRITPQQVDAVLASIPEFQENGNFSPQRFHLILNKLGYSEASFVNEIQNLMMINQVQQGIVGSAFALPKDAEWAYKLINQKRDFAYLEIPYSRFMDKIKIPDAEVQKFYETHKEMFKIPELVRIEYLELSLPNIKQNLSFSDQELKQYYQNNLTNFTRPPQWQVAHVLIQVPKKATPEQINQAQQKINAIYQQVQEGKNFSDLARKNSQDILTAKNGGVLPWFSPDMTEPAIVEAVKTLKVNAVSSPTRTSYGFEIFKLLATKPKEILPFEQVRDQVANMLANEKGQKVFANKNEQLANLTYANPDSLTEAAKQLKLPIKTTDYFSRNGTKIGVTSNSKVVAAAFSPDVLTNKNNSDLIQVDSQTYIVLRVSDYKPSMIQPFSDAQSSINKQLMQQAAEKQASLFGDQLIKQVQDKKPLSKIAKANKLNLVTGNKVSRSDTNINAQVLEQAFRLSRPTKEIPQPIKGFQLPSGNYVVLMINQVYDGDLQSLTPEQRQVFQQQLAKVFGDFDYTLYNQFLRDHSTLKFTNK